MRSHRISSAKGRRTAARVAVYGALIVGALYTVGPLVWMLSTSFKPNGLVFERPPRLISDIFTLDAYQSIFSDPQKLRYFVNSYVVTVCVVLLTILVSVLAAFALSRYRFPLKGAITTVTVSIQAVPPITLMIPYFGLVVALNIYDSYLALILTYLVITLPYSVLMIMSYLDTIPKEIDEAVKVDGGSSFRTLWQILIPISVPGLIAAGTFTYMISWNEYLFALTLTKSGDVRTIPVGIQMLMGEHTFEWSEMMAMSVLGGLPVLVLFALFQKRFVSGLSQGAVKA